MTNLSGIPGELHMTITVTRKETGKEEQYELIGTPVIDPDQSTTKENQNGRDSFDRSA